MHSMASAVPASLQPDGYAWMILGCLISLVFPASCFYLLRSTSDGKLHDLGGLPILSAWSFVSKRGEFMMKNLHFSRGLPFRFRVLQYRVVGLTGLNGRQFFFNNSSLDFTQGYRIFRGNIPRIENVDIPIEATENDDSDRKKRLHFILRKERIVDLLPVLLDDLNRSMLNWGREGVINPFNEIYDLVFQMTLRLATCEDLCRDPGAAKMIAGFLDDLEKSATPACILFPWLPSPSKRKNNRATRGLYNTILKFVQDRRAAGASTMDPIDCLIQKGDKDVDVVAMVMLTLFAGIVNTGINSCWALLYLGVNSEWRQRAISEIQSMISAHGDTADAESLYEQLASVPFSAWEDKLPALDLVIRETIRIASSANSALLRRNVKSDIDAGGVQILRGDFMAYSSAEVHMNKDIYTDPETFDPGRYEDGRNEDKRVDLGYIGWGAGRHPCAGMRIATLEMKVALAMMLLGYEYTVVDEQGNQANKLPGLDRRARPLGKVVYLKFRRIKK